MNYEEMANLKMYSSDLEKELTVKECFKAIMVEFWSNTRCGERLPQYDIFYSEITECLVKNNIIKAELDEEGNIVSIEDDGGDIIVEIIKTF